MKKLIIANWKLNPKSQKEAVALAMAEDAEGTVICPPFVFLESLGKTLKNAALGAQDVFWEESGAYTGEISPPQLKKLGVRYVIVGHSERRRHLGETDELINRKLRAALRADLRVILCVGESYSTHRKGPAAVKKFISSQLVKGLKGAGRERIIIAYEPIWAIGTGKADTPEETADMASHIKSRVGKGVPVLYGGSVNAKNAKSFLVQPALDGLLVGGASLKPAEFGKITGT